MLAQDGARPNSGFTSSCVEPSAPPDVLALVAADLGAALRRASRRLPPGVFEVLRPLADVLRTLGGLVRPVGGAPPEVNAKRFSSVSGALPLLAALAGAAVPSGPGGASAEAPGPAPSTPPVKPRSPSPPSAVKRPRVELALADLLPAPAISQEEKIQQLRMVIEGLPLKLSGPDHGGVGIGSCAPAPAPSSPACSTRCSRHRRLRVRNHKRRQHAPADLDARACVHPAGSDGFGAGDCGFGRDGPPC